MADILPTQKEPLDKQPQADSTISAADLKWAIGDTKFVQAAQQQRPDVPLDHNKLEGVQARTLRLNFGDRIPEPNDSQAWRGVTTLQIDHIPTDVQIKSYVDKDGVFYWFNRGDNQQHHHLPPDVKTVVLNGFPNNADDLRLAGLQAALKDSDPHHIGFSAVNNNVNPVDFAMRMSSLGSPVLKAYEQAVAECVYNSPNNPWFRMDLADVLTWEAAQAAADPVKHGANAVNFNNPETQKFLQAALGQAQVADQLVTRDLANGQRPWWGSYAYYNDPGYQAHTRVAMLTLALKALPNIPPMELP